MVASGHLNCQWYYLANFCVQPIIIIIVLAMNVQVLKLLFRHNTATILFLTVNTIIAFGCLTLGATNTLPIGLFSMTAFPSVICTIFMVHSLPSALTPALTSALTYALTSPLISAPTSALISAPMLLGCFSRRLPSVYKPGLFRHRPDRSRVHHPDDSVGMG
jgi:hypothetical protein